MYYGIIKFFDDKKNNFGFIIDIYPKEIEGDKIYVTGDDVICNKSLLNEGKEVIFEIKEFGKRKRAINVNLLSNIDIKEKQKLSLLFEGDKLQLFVYELLTQGATYTCDDINIICNKILEKPMLKYPYYSLDILRIINVDDYLNKFIQLLIKTDDLNKLNLYKEEKELLPLVANNWLFENENTTQDLINKIKENSPSSDSYKQFIFMFQKKLNIYIPDTIINFYSVFFNIDDITDYFEIIKDISTYEIIRQAIIKYFIDEEQQQMVLSILSNQIIKNYSNIKEKLTDVEIYQLFISAEEENINKILSNWSGDNYFANRNFFEEIKNIKKYEAYGLIISSVIKKILDCDNIIIRNYSLSDYKPFEKYFDYLLLYADYNFLEYLIRTKLFSNLEVFKDHLIILSKPEVVVLLNKILSISKDVEVKIKIKTIIFLNTENIPSKSLIEDIVNLPISFLQQFIINKLIFLYSKNKIDNKFLDELFGLRWSSLSALVFISFIKNRPIDKSSALICLDDTFRKHLSLIVSDGYEDNYEQLSVINLIAKTCDGRKQYLKKVWEKENIKRYYTSKDNPNISNSMNIYCEGRYWKSEQLHDSITKQPFDVKMYWCRGDICNGLNNKEDLNLDYSRWTLVEVSKVFHIKLDERIFSIIGGWANRMKEIIEKLRCRICNSVLRPLPVDSKPLGYYATSVFNCLSEKCSEYKKTIRITHCLNGKCRELLDSRDLKKCTKGWLICTCGTCCPDHSGKDYMPKNIE